MAGYRHGVFTSEVPTSLLPPVRVDASLPVVIGTAPVHTLEDGTAAPINTPVLIFDRSEYISRFGHVPTGERSHDYTLTEFADVYFGSYGVCPVVFINVFDPDAHTKPVQGGEESETAPDVSKVTSLDVIGGIDGPTLQKTGLELISEVFPRFRLVPGQILAPGFSGDPAVAVTLGAKCANINGHFKATGIIDIPDAVAGYTEAPEWINDNNLTDKNLIAFLGKPQVGDALHWGSTHLAGVTALRDANSAGVPYWSPSNNRLICNGLVHNGRELALGPDAAQWLNGNGIVTGMNWIGGMVAWGNRTAAYPGITDVKDTFIPIRRMFNWVANTIVLTYWQKVDSPMNRRLVNSIVDSINVWLNGLTAREYILGGRLMFLENENPTTDMMDGKLRFHLYLCTPPPAEDIEFIFEYDPSYFETLFS
ncbi:hypothetical protein LJC47_08260 [Desulfosarcina sp. OttesenSCG-928-B08]|nr:hypothetical protein [Desulfosarcina sp. OttesenSCG-928-B08]